MRIIQCMFGDVVALDIIDEFTYGNRKEFTTAVKAIKQSGHRHLIINLREVTYLDSAAIGLLALTAQQFAAENRKISLVAPQGTVKQILEMANIDKMIPVFPTEEAATGTKAA